MSTSKVVLIWVTVLFLEVLLMTEMSTSLEVLLLIWVILCNGLRKVSILYALYHNRTIDVPFKLSAF